METDGSLKYADGKKQWEKKRGKVKFAKQKEKIREAKTKRKKIRISCDFVKHFVIWGPVSNSTKNLNFSFRCVQNIDFQWIDHINSVHIRIVVTFLDTNQELKILSKHTYTKSNFYMKIYNLQSRELFWISLDFEREPTPLL